MSEPRLCVTVAARTIEGVRQARDAADADLVELRLDALDAIDRPDVRRALEGRRLPAIVTCRAAWEGGGFTGTEDERRRILETALDLGAEFVDIEAAAEFAPELIRSRQGRGIILSEHVFGQPPADLRGRYNRLRASGAEVPKLAIQVSSLEEMLPLFDLARNGGGGSASGHVLIAMGPVGVASRVLAARLGNRWTYAGDGIAPGQIPASRLLGDFRFRRISPGAALYGVVGNPVSHSRSPAMHNAGFAALGLDAAYVPLEARSAADFVRFARQVSLRGASVTAPFKVPLMPYLDEIEPLAKRVGAINTIVVRDGKWSGANTDVEGFLAPLARRTTVSGLRASVIGAGGAARGVAVALADRGADVTICARRPAQASAIADLVGGKVGEFPPRGSSWDLLVNATPVGAATDPRDPMEGAPLDGRIVFDLVYAPARTPLLARAEQSGCETIGGIEMLIAQAERQFELWTGERPPAGLFEAAAIAADGEP